MVLSFVGLFVEECEGWRHVVRGPTIVRQYMLQCVKIVRRIRGTTAFGDAKQLAIAKEVCIASVSDVEFSPRYSQNANTFCLSGLKFLQFVRENFTR